jgi:hypothetical protein
MRVRDDGVRDMSARDEGARGLSDRIAYALMYYLTSCIFFCFMV